MKKVWIALVLLLIIAAAAITLVYLRDNKPLEQDRTLYSYQGRSVEQIRIVSKDLEVLFEKKQDKWAMIKPKPYALEADAINRLENRLKDFLASRVMDEKAVDLTKYGLDQPAATISFKLDDGTQNTLLIGSLTASKVQYYAKDTAREQIYILGSYDVENFLAPVSEFRNRSILKVDSSSISTVGLNAAGKREFKLVGDEEGNWNIVEPLEGKARGDAVDEMLGDILKLRIKDFIVEQTDKIEKYGLDQPTYSLELADKNQNAQRIDFGKVDESKQLIYFKMSGSDEIYSLSLEVFDPRRFKIANFLSEAPMSVAIGDISKVTITEGGKVVEFERDDSKGEDVFTCSGKTVNPEDFTTLYVNIMALTAEGYDPANKGGEPVLTVVLERKDKGEPIRMEFVQRDDLSYYMVLNGEPRPFYIGERKVDLIKWWRDRILEKL